MGRLAGKTAIITGGASGQGAAQARLFAAEGAHVMIADIGTDRAQALVDGIGPSARHRTADVTEESAWAALVAETEAWTGRIDILVNGAALYDPKPFPDSAAGDLDRHYRLNVRGPFLGMKAVFDLMVRGGGGSIINVASGVALRSFPGMLAYSASKWSLRGLSRSAALDLVPFGIRVNTIFPGLIDTPLLGGNSPEYLDFLRQMVPMKRLGQSDEVAFAALFLASDESSYVTGAELSVCGGINI
ncbi:hypothetical protein CAF53_03410 [Sphingobium sp. LB126]|uniref:SDR family NAD(P)-dependent oxidoreductase n=1 Tax=Sphingobium sp. LB126 TaxID=1983755 RepID=UPI000C200D2F|nr:SDR family NAD(P)-dependent oxidoreductase [Sphingobium sp. LB126]PJG47393.1 hypothetical protein CAF53_03410 [Sphingobium sp. LB126]